MTSQLYSDWMTSQLYMVTGWWRHSYTWWLGDVTVIQWLDGDVTCLKKPPLLQIRNAASPIRMYSIVHTGPNTELGGFQLGFCRESYLRIFSHLLSSGQIRSRNWILRRLRYNLYQIIQLFCSNSTHQGSPVKPPTIRPTAAPPPTVIPMISTKVTKLSKALGWCAMVSSQSSVGAEFSGAIIGNIQLSLITRRSYYNI